MVKNWDVEEKKKQILLDDAYQQQQTIQEQVYKQRNIYICCSHLFYFISIIFSLSLSPLWGWSTQSGSFDNTSSWVCFSFSFFIQLLIDLYIEFLSLLLAALLLILMQFSFHHDWISMLNSMYARISCIINNSVVIGLYYVLRLHILNFYLFIFPFKFPHMFTDIHVCVCVFLSFFTTLCSSVDSQIYHDIFVCLFFYTHRIFFSSLLLINTFFFLLLWYVKEAMGELRTTWLEIPHFFYVRQCMIYMAKNTHTFRNASNSKSAKKRYTGGEEKKKWKLAPFSLTKLF